MTLVHTPPIATTHRYQYSPSPSVASSASSSQSSVWSVASTVSNATSIASIPFLEGPSAPGTNIIPPLTIQRRLSGPERTGWLPPNPSSIPSGLRTGDPHPHPHPALTTVSQEPLPIEQRQHPRRTNRLVEGGNAGCPASEVCPLPPVPTLQRQVDRKVNFVDNLVGTLSTRPRKLSNEIGAKIQIRRM